MKLFVPALLVACVQAKTLRKTQDTFSLESDTDLVTLFQYQELLDESGHRNLDETPCTAEKDAFASCARLSQSCADCLNNAWDVITTGSKQCQQFHGEICTIPDTCPCLRSFCDDEAYEFYGCILNSGTGGACGADPQCEPSTTQPPFTEPPKTQPPVKTQPPQPATPIATNCKSSPPCDLLSFGDQGITVHMTIGTTCVEWCVPDAVAKMETTLVAECGGCN